MYNRSLPMCYLLSTKFEANTISSIVYFVQNSLPRYLTDYYFLLPFRIKSWTEKSSII